MTKSEITLEKERILACTSLIFAVDRFKAAFASNNPIGMTAFDEARASIEQLRLQSHSKIWKG